MTVMYTDADVKHWQPELIKVTQINNPMIDNGEPTPAFLNPANISFIVRGVVTWNTPDGQTGNPLTCTNIYLIPGGHVSVVESPEEVNKLRNKAFGVKPKLMEV